MKISAALTAELDQLTQALDLPGTDVAETLTRLAADAQTAVESYLGLSVAITANWSQFEVTILDDVTQPHQIRTSLLVPLSPATIDGSTETGSTALILYAARPGAFVDLAADLAWITGRSLADFRLDEHRILPPGFTNSSRLSAASAVNQALGVLIGRGSTPEQAERDLYARAVAGGTDLLGAATLTLTTLRPPSFEPERP